MSKSRHYVDNKLLNDELIKSHEQNQLTNKAVSMFQLMINRISATLPYTSPEFKEDVQAHAMYIVARNWHKYDTDRGSAFSYFTTVIANGLRQGFNRYRTGRTGQIHISFDQLFANNDEL